MQRSKSPLTCVDLLVIVLAALIFGFEVAADAEMGRGSASISARGASVWAALSLKSGVCCLEPTFRGGDAEWADLCSDDALDDDAMLTRPLAFCGCKKSENRRAPPSSLCDIKILRAKAKLRTNK